MNQCKKRILIVDDERAITRLIRLNLEQAGEYEVKEENDSSHALAAAREFLPDLILLDVLMPGVDGGELATEFRASRSFRDIPIVFLTAAVTPVEVTSHGGYIGGDRFLAKPVSQRELIECLRQELKKHPGQPAAEKPKDTASPAERPVPQKPAEDANPHFAY